MTQPVSDLKSHSNDNIAFAAKVLGKSKDRAAVFAEIHSGKKRTKTATEIAHATGLKRKRVLEEAVKLVHKGIIKPDTRDGEIAYTREGFFYTYKQQILAFFRNPGKLKTYATKYNPKVTVSRLSILIPKSQVRTAIVTIDGIDSFSRVKKIKKVASVPLDMKESVFKRGVQKIIGQSGVFKDWGGETSDLFTTRLKFKGKRCGAAFGFKGRGKKGLLTPANMGKNGDQIHRLFFEDADIFLVQYVGPIAPTVLQQMATYAQSKSTSTGRRIFYGIIDGDDSTRLVSAYPHAFR